jgi:hypothetical protein
MTIWKDGKELEVAESDLPNEASQTLFPTPHSCRGGTH